jgi:hypothetical protein
MKTVLVFLAVALAMGALAFTCSAQQTPLPPVMTNEQMQAAYLAPQPWPPRSNPPKMGLGGQIVVPTGLQWVFPANLSGDVGLIYEQKGIHTTAPGVGVDLINYDNGLLVGRFEGFFASPDAVSTQKCDVVGASFMINLLQLAATFGGSAVNTSTLNSILTAMNPSIGFFGGYDFNNKALAGGPMFSIINIPLGTTGTAYKTASVQERQAITDKEQDVLNKMAEWVKTGKMTNEEMGQMRQALVDNQ